MEMSVLVAVTTQVQQCGGMHEKSLEWTRREAYLFKKNILLMFIAILCTRWWWYSQIGCNYQQVRAREAHCHLALKIHRFN